MLLRVSFVLLWVCVLELLLLCVEFVFVRRQSAVPLGSPKFGWVALRCGRAILHPGCVLMRPTHIRAACVASVASGKSGKQKDLVN